jgi:hypothetical protein
MHFTMPAWQVLCLQRWWLPLMQMTDALLLLLLFPLLSCCSAPAWQLDTIELSVRYR